MKNIKRVKTKKIKTEVGTSYGKFDVVLEREPDMGGYLVSVPKRADVISWGKNLSHAKLMAKDAIECSVIGDVIVAAQKANAITIGPRKQKVNTWA
ncbi:MAG: hypothetical protein UY54_C0018G0001 [Parcubacteria group bacterium GW2011_GWA2_50_10b]|nr:MAG: hypothetical protein UY54_C0018G0001 [Parcubacteria group bacterium GW2011_GWA2_50_10b]